MGVLDVPVPRVDKVYRWASSWSGLKPLFSVMTSPPVITRSPSTSSVVNPAYVNGAVMKSITDTDRMINVANNRYNDSVVGGGTRRRPQNITNTDGAPVDNSGNIQRVRFMTDATAVDFCVRESNLQKFNVIVDGEIAYRDVPGAATLNSGNNRYFQINFGSDTKTYAKSDSSTGVVSGGSGYAVGDMITLSDGLVVQVSQVSGSAVALVAIINRGSAASLPSGTDSQVSTTGSGTGFQMGLSFYGSRHSVKRMRNIELLFAGNDFYGIVTPSLGDIVLPYYPNTFLPTICIIGDSIQAGTYYDYVGGHIGSSIAQYLGLWDNHIISAQGGTGWNITNGTADKWSSTNRIDDFIREDADIYLFIGSQNDAAGASLTAAVTATIDAIHAAKPNAYIIGIGNVLGGSTSVAASIEAGFLAASNQAKTAFINNQSPVKWLDSSYYGVDYTESSDGNHLNQWGQDQFAKICANYVATTLINLVNLRN